MTHTQFGALVGISQQAVSEMVASGFLRAEADADEWLLAYCLRLREQAAGRYTDGPLDLVQERAALAREQRLGLELKNGVLRGEYAPLSLLAEVLGAASTSVAERFDHLPGTLKKACPQLDDAARDQVMAVIASARNEWVRGTSQLIAPMLLETDIQADEDEPIAD